MMNSIGITRSATIIRSTMGHILLSVVIARQIIIIISKRRIRYVINELKSAAALFANNIKIMKYVILLPEKLDTEKFSNRTNNG